MIDSLLDRFQSAQRIGHSTETAELRVLNDILCSADKGDFVLLVLLDLSAAFDTIDHSILLKRLQDKVGTLDLAYQWFHSYVADRYHFVQVNMASSDSIHSDAVYHKGQC